MAITTLAIGQRGTAIPEKQEVNEMSSMTATAYWLKKESFPRLRKEKKRFTHEKRKSSRAPACKGEPRQRLLPALRRWSPVCRDHGGCRVQDSAGGESTGERGGRSLSIEGSTFLHMYVRKLPKAGEGAFKWISKDGVQCSHRARNMACSHQTTWKKS